MSEMDMRKTTHLPRRLAQPSPPIPWVLEGLLDLHKRAAGENSGKCRQQEAAGTNMPYSTELRPLTWRAKVAGLATRPLGSLNAGLAGQPVETRGADSARSAGGADRGDDGLDPVRLLRIGFFHSLLHILDLRPKRIIKSGLPAC